MTHILKTSSLSLRALGPGERDDRLEGRLNLAGERARDFLRPFLRDPANREAVKALLLNNSITQTEGPWLPTGLPPLTDGSAPIEEIELLDQLVDAVTCRRLTLFETRLARIHLGSSGGAPSTAPPEQQAGDSASVRDIPPKSAAAATGAGTGSAAGTPRTEHWIEIELVDDEGNPVPGELYRVEFPDGSVAQGRLPANGRAHLVSPVAGDCKITFPDLDKEDWEPAKG